MVTDRPEEDQKELAEPVVPPQLRPRLFVDWGIHPQIGEQARPDFLIDCPPHLGVPSIVVQIDNELDQESHAYPATPTRNEKGLWSLPVSFRMTTQGQDCRPGQYRINVAIEFRKVTARKLRCFKCSIRLHVRKSAGSESVLEIDGDGQAIVNLQGVDFHSFDRVILKASDSGVVNLQGPAPIDGAPSIPQITDKDTERPGNYQCQYELQIDHERERELPLLSPTHTSRVPLESAGLFFKNGLRFILIPKRRVTLGRSRDNSIVTRLLPRNSANDERTKQISRTHVELELTENGLVICDRSKTGTVFDRRIISGDAQLSHDQHGEKYSLCLGSKETQLEPLELEVQPFASRSMGRQSIDDIEQLYCEFVGSHETQLQRNARKTKLDSIKLTRSNNLPRECYLLLYREVLIGNSPDRCPIPLSSDVIVPPARIFYLGNTFWLERLNESFPIRVEDQEIEPRTLVPLVPGMRILFGDDEATFDRSEQQF